MFHIDDFLSDEMGHIDHLARSGDVQGIKGYAIRLACDLASYGEVDFRQFAVAIARLTDDFVRD